MVDSVELETKTFPHLPAAPIVEAVIYWQARAERPWEPENLRRELVKRLPEYPKVQSQHAFCFTLEASTGQGASPPKTSQEIGWDGFRVSTPDGLNVAQFKKDGLTFSRLRPYQDWEVFETEGRRLWRVFAELAAPSQIQRLGVRFINKFPIRGIDRLGEYLLDPPTCPLSLPLENFLYQSTFDVPKNDLAVKVVKTLQSSTSAGVVCWSLIVDTSVLTKRPIPCEDAALDERLPKMHFLKNAVFFSLLTEETIHAFQEG